MAYAVGRLVQDKHNTPGMRGAYVVGRLVQGKHNIPGSSALGIMECQSRGSNHGDFLMPGWITEDHFCYGSCHTSVQYNVHVQR